MKKYIVILSLAIAAWVSSPLQAAAVTVTCTDVTDLSTCSVNPPNLLISNVLRRIESVDACAETGDGQVTCETAYHEVYICDIVGNAAVCDIPGNTTINCDNLDPANGATECVITSAARTETITALQQLNLTASQETFGEHLANMCERTNLSPALQRDCGLFLDELYNGNNATQILEQITPNGAGAPAEAVSTSIAQQTRNVGLRQAQHHGGNVGGGSVDASGLRVYAGGTQLGEDWRYVQYLRGGAAGADAQNPFGKLGVFVNGTIVTGDKNTTDNELGFNLSSFEMTSGVDYRANAASFYGMGFGLSSSSTNMDRGRGSLDTTGYNLIFYGGYAPNAEFYVDANLTLGGSDFSQERNIRLATPSVNQIAAADYFGRQFSLTLASGYNFAIGSLQMTPFGQLQMMSSNIDDYREKMRDLDAPGSGWSLNIEEQDTDSTTLTLGGQFTYAVNQRWGVLIPQARLELVNEFNDNQQVVKGNFIGDPNKEQFRIPGDKTDDSYMNVGLGLSAVRPGGSTIYLFYQALLGLNDVTNHSINIGARWEF